MTETFDLDKEAQIWRLGTIHKAPSPGSRRAGAPLSLLNIKQAFKTPKDPLHFSLRQGLSPSPTACSDLNSFVVRTQKL